MRFPLTRVLVSGAAVIGIATASLAGGASAGFAASQPYVKPVVGVQTASVLAVNNLGLTTTQAKHWQCWLRGWGFNPGTIDGQLGTDSWKAAQRFFNYYDEYVDGRLVVDGVVGTGTVKALQNWLGVGIDGVVGTQTRAAFAKFNNTNYC
ncbi:peptidoglycan-binding protein [Streptomyces sp. NBC_00335]|uniref:peptidoglycan-binding domain-containing protein n=1 Tax=unclassified Streptomyces TaxID=2593676 RepID=UPI00225C0143|nr:MULTISPECIES: peptidoglycan-binding domain-containing protein [unclassified Streptomyces]MCX5409818.1 peptidoglycan-binding protein [Streptomyces sp. NBC_00086]